MSQGMWIESGFMTILTAFYAEEFKDAFELFDKDADGIISASELKDIMMFLGALPA